MDFTGKNVLVYGTGVSGIAASNLLLSKNAKVLLFDENEELDTERVLSELDSDTDVTVLTGSLTEEALSTVDLAILSPGVPTDILNVEMIREREIPVWGEIELGFQCQNGRILAITGTNGKTTTTSLLGEIMKNDKKDVRIAGNIGIPYTREVVGSTDDTVMVAEISSFQLETVVDFHPNVTAILNITPDHLNRHHTMENYVDAKLMITRNQTKDDICVLNYEDEILKERAADIPAKIVWFSSRQSLKEGFYLDGDMIVCREKEGEEPVELIRTDELNILGRHNHENVMAAAAMARAAGVSFENIREVLRTFTAVEHRIEYVAEKRGIRFYNDSKGTNPDAAIQAIRAMDRPTCLIAGGYDKQSDYSEWIQSFGGKVRKLVLIGQTAEKIAAEAKKQGFYNYVFADSLQQAVEICYQHANTGEAVLLSPACASWGMFPNYEVRGRMFKDMVHALKE